MKTLLLFAQWFLSALGALILIGCALGGSVPATLLLGLAVVVVFPPLQKLLESKLPLIRPRVVKLILFFLLLIGAVIVDSPNARYFEQAALCDAPQAGVCQQDKTMFVKDTRALFITAMPHNVADGVSVKIETKHTSEPNKETVADTTTIQAKFQDGKAQFQLPLETLPVGFYEVLLTSEDNQFTNIRKTFTVWQTQQDVEQRSAGKLSNASTQLTSFKLCEESSETSACQNDSSTFTTGVRTIAAQVDIENPADNTGIRFIWRYLDGEAGAAQEIKNKVQTIDAQTGGFTYSLSNEDGFPTGTYEVLIALETNNARPIRREFSVK